MGFEEGELFLMPFLECGNDPVHFPFILKALSNEEQVLPAQVIQVSIGKRSRSPLRPLSLRIMSRADLMMLASWRAVVLSDPFFFRVIRPLF